MQKTPKTEKGLVLEGGAMRGLFIPPEKPLEISRICHDPETMQRIYDAGRTAAEKSDLSAF